MGIQKSLSISQDIEINKQHTDVMNTNGHLGGISLISISIMSLLIQANMKHKNIDLKIEMPQHAFQSSSLNSIQRNNEIG